MHKLRNEILFLQLEDSNYMLGKIEAVQTVTCYLCKVNFTSGRIPEFYFNILQRFSSIPSAEDIRFFCNLSLKLVPVSIRVWKI